MHLIRYNSQVLKAYMFRHRAAILRERYTARHDAHHTLHVDEMPSDHIRTRQMFVCILRTDNKQLRTYTWDCSLS
jgi:hypothetical protein